MFPNFISLSLQLQATSTVLVRNSRVRVTNLTVDDTTGHLDMALWRNTADTDLQIGLTYTFSYIALSTFNGAQRGSTTRHSTVMVSSLWLTQAIVPYFTTTHCKPRLQITIHFPFHDCTHLQHTTSFPSPTITPANAHFLHIYVTNPYLTIILF